MYNTKGIYIKRHISIALNVFREIQTASALHVTAMERYPIYNQKGKLLNPQDEFNSTRNVTKFYLRKDYVPIIKEVNFVEFELKN